MTANASSSRSDPPAGSGRPRGGYAVRPAYSLDSVDNALLVLAVLAEVGEVRVYEVAERLGVARSTAHRILATLVHRGFALQQGHSYRPGPALVEAGRSAATRIDLRQVARPHLRALAEETGETVHLAVLEGNSIRFVDGVESTQVVRVGLRLGMVLPAHATAVGKALLATLDGEQVRALYPRGVQTLTGNTLRTVEGIAEELAEVARQGYATNVGESVDEVAAVGVALRDRDGAALGAIAVAAPRERMPVTRVPYVASRLHRVALAITSSLQNGA